MHRGLGLSAGGQPQCPLTLQLQPQDSHAEVLREEAAIPEQTCPELDSHDAEDEEDEEAEEEDVPQHGQRVKEQRHQDAHT